MVTEAVRIRNREAKRKSRSLNPGRDTEWMRAWRAANPERARQLSLENAARRDRKTSRQWFRGYIQGIKLAAGCADCGYADDPARLCFDHRPGTVKIMNVAHMGWYSQAKIDAEIEKCDVRCGSCHRKRHAAEQAA